MVCPGCGSEMKVIAVIQQPVEINRILRHHSILDSLMGRKG